MNIDKIKEEARGIVECFDLATAKTYPVDTSNMGRYIDHTRLKVETTRSDIAAFCAEAKEFRYRAVCFNPGYVAYGKELVSGSEVKVATVIGFPLGATTPLAKQVEARDAVAAGADELDMVINVGALKDEEYQLVYDDIAGVVRSAGHKAIVKVILETSALTDEEKVIGSLLSRRAGASFVKTSTGFGSGGATVHDVALMKRTVGDTLQVKASTGVKSREIAIELIRAGATRLGTSSGKAILSESGGESGADY